MNGKLIETWTKTNDGYVYEAKDENGDRTLLTIWKMENDMWRAKNISCDITAVIRPLNQYNTGAQLIEYKLRDRAGRYRTTTKLAAHHLSWLVWYLENHGFIRKAEVK